MVKTQSSTAEIESILDSDQRDLIGDFSKVIQVISRCSVRSGAFMASLGRAGSKQLG